MDSHKTAITRRKPSRPLRAALKLGAVRGRVLDFGCGKGRDVAELSELGYKVRGYDLHFEPAKPRGTFHTVLMTYVVNVLKAKQRNEALQAAWDYVKPGGRLIVTARSERDIEAAAVQGRWDCIGRGYMTTWGTYQCGYTLHQLQRVLRDLDGITNMQTGPLNAGGVMVLLLKS
jgi:DNA phosphorothioation-associated putative methyltransferase